jgi:HK97 gp10 family phage protein
MSDNSTVEFTGIKEISRLVAEGTNQGLQALAILGTSHAKLLAPFDLGQLRNSIQYRLANNRSGGLNDSQGEHADESLRTPSAGTAVVGATANYAVYQEFGTRYIPPQPFLRPSLALLAGDTPEVVKEKMNAEFKLGPLKYGQARETFQV